MVRTEPKEAGAKQWRTPNVEGRPRLLFYAQLRFFEQQRLGPDASGCIGG